MTQKRVWAAGGLTLVIVAGALAYFTIRRQPVVTTPTNTANSAVAVAPSNVSGADEVLEQLRKQTEALRRVRLTVEVDERIARLQEGAEDTPDQDPLAVARTATSKTAVQNRRQEALLFDGESWRRETVMQTASAPAGGRLISGYDGEVTRTFSAEAKSGNEPRALLGDAPPLDSALLILAGREMETLEGIVWKEINREQGLVTLTGTRDAASVTAVLREKPTRLESLRVAETVQTPAGEVPQTVEVKATYEADEENSRPKFVEELAHLGGDANVAALTRFTVRKLERDPAIRPEDLTVKIPTGTQVIDMRVKPPLQYVQGQREYTVEEARAMAEERYASVGGKAPDWSLKTLEGESVKAGSYLGKVVLLTWFASW